jgi:HEAT repeat protein
MLRLVSVLLAAALQSDAERIPRWVERLGADFLEDRRAAAASLKAAGPAAHEVLLGALGSADFRVRRAALELLAPHALPRIREKAAELFRTDEDAEVRRAAFAALRVLGAGAEAELLEALKSPAAEFRRGAVESLEPLRSPRAAKPLAALFGVETEKGIKELAFKALVGLGAAAEDFLVKCLASAEPKERREAMAALKDVSSPAVLKGVGELFSQGLDEDLLEPAADYLRRSGTAAEGYFAAGLGSPKEGVRLHSLRGLQGLGSRRELARTGALLLEDPAKAVRDAAAERLGALEGPEAEAALVRGLEAKDAATVAAALRRLGDRGAEGCRADVSKRFRSEKDPAVREAAFHYFRKLGLRAEAELLEILSGDERALRIQASAALAEAGSEAAVPKLIEALTELDPELKRAMEAALARLGSKALGAVREAVRSGRLREKVAESIAAKAVQGEVERALDAALSADGEPGYYPGMFRDLEALGRETVAPVLVRMVRESGYAFTRPEGRSRVDGYAERIQELAVMALGDLGGPSAREPLRALLKETRPWSSVQFLHEEAVASLHRLGDPQALEDYEKATSARVDACLSRPEGKSEARALLIGLGSVRSRAGKPAAASEAYHRALAIADVGDATAALYNLACLSAKTGDRAAALEWLARAVAAGYRDADWMRRDRDLDAVRDEPAFRTLLDGLSGSRK